MEQTLPTLDIDIYTIVSQLPQPVRAFLASGAVDKIITQIHGTYPMRAAQSTMVEREILFLLLGIKNPTEFYQTLTNESGLDSKTIEGIMKILNDQVFVPLQQNIKQNGRGARPAPQPPQNLPGVMGDERLLSDHEVPHIEVGVARPAQFTPPPRPPILQPTRPPLPQPLPPQAPRAFTNPPPPPPKPIATYSADPYREPFDRK